MKTKIKTSFGKMNFQTKKNLTKSENKTCRPKVSLLSAPMKTDIIPDLKQLSKIFKQCIKIGKFILSQKFPFIFYLPMYFSQNWIRIILPKYYPECSDSVIGEKKHSDQGKNPKLLVSSYFHSSFSSISSPCGGGALIL